MLQITIPGGEWWDEEKEEFFYTKPATLKLEHSLISISKWESKWHLPFFETEKNDEQIYDYIKCMTLNQEVDDLVYRRIPASEVQRINDYIADPMTATKINSLGNDKKQSGEYITSELIYYWMIAYNVPVEFQKWHINRLIMLIRVCSEKNKPSKKMNARQIAEMNRARNEARKAKYHTRG